jgi:hypothetical protein
MKIGVCDLCMLEKVGGEKKLVESKYRWGYKGGFKLDLCHFHTKVNNPFKGKSQKDAEAAYWKMRFGKDEEQGMMGDGKVHGLDPDEKDAFEGRLERAGWPKAGR